MYSEQGLLARIRSLTAQGFQSLIVVSNCMPGSPHWWVASAIARSTLRASRRSIGSPDVTARVQ